MAASIDPEKQPFIPVVNDTIDKKARREQYAEKMEQKEVAEGLLDNPSVDAETQRVITMNYRALHQQIKDAGLYSCRYVEYLKESIRYVLLFAAFLYLLHAKWYLTSALFLGMFWVYIYILSHIYIIPIKRLPTSSNKLCSQPTTPATAA